MAEGGGCGEEGRGRERVKRGKRGGTGQNEWNRSRKRERGGERNGGG